MENNIKDIINKALISNRYNDYKCELELVSSFIECLNDNLDLINEANNIDINNHNGFKLDKNIIDKILNRYKYADVLINSKKSINKSDSLLKSTVYDKLGVLLVLFDGNTYTLIEIILLAILTHNTVIFSYNGFMLGVNKLIINIIEDILEKNDLKKEMISQIINANNKELFENFKTIDATIIVGEHTFINKNLKDASTKVITSGFMNYDIYIDSLKNMDFIKKIINTNLNINLYINSNLKHNLDNVIEVDDIEEAITRINCNSASFSSAIFTEDKINASKFIKNIKSKYVFVNASPTLEQTLDIKQEDLLKEKNIIISK